MYKRIEQVSQRTKYFQYVKNNTRNILFGQSLFGPTPLQLRYDPC